MTMRQSIAAAQTSQLRADATGAMSVEFRFGAADPVFAGHFPQRPILPGVYQLELARVVAEQALGCSLFVREISRAKFQQPIQPDETVRVDLILSEKDGIVQARAGFSVGGRAAGETTLLLCRNDSKNG
jgi:3-hydroxymyristoyl/3-hydroxydecanoyl-(acyl carrier protein) dehydratase